MAKKDKKDDGRSAAKGKDHASGKVSKPAPRPAAATTRSAALAPPTAVRAAPRTVGETVASASVADDTGSSAPVTTDSPTSVEALAGPTGSSPGSSASVSVPTPTPVEALAEPADGAAMSSPESSSSGSSSDSPSTALARRAPSVPTPATADFSADDVAEALLVPLRIARRVLPERRTPVVLGVAALTLVGIVDLPVAVGIGLGWEVLRRWTPPEPPRSRG